MSQSEYSGEKSKISRLAARLTRIGKCLGSKLLAESAIAENFGIRVAMKTQMGNEVPWVQEI